MKYVDEFRDEEAAKILVNRIHESVKQPWTIMEVCGGQTHSILQYGIDELLPGQINLVHGPGCPVCVTPVEMVDRAVSIATRPDVVFCTFGDMLRVPGTNSDLSSARADGADVRIVYSPLDALRIAKQLPDKKVIMFAVGFETTAPANAMAVAQAKRLGLKNFFALVSHVTVPPVMSHLLESEDNLVQAFIGPGHVCTIMGLQEYQDLVERHRIPIVIAGFEPIDLLDAVLACVQQLESRRAEVENRYGRSVRSDGSVQARQLMSEVFQLSDRLWRGLGPVPRSGYRLSEEYAEFDAELVFDVQHIEASESPLCISGEILKGRKKPFQCTAFGTTCTPETPLGATMVSSEGTCANYYKFHRHKDAQHA